MNQSIDADLLGLLRGELEAEKAAELEQRLTRDNELAHRFEELETAWRGIELPPPAPIPLGLRSRIVAQAEELERARHELEWSRAPAWVRTSAALALIAGIVLGVGVSSFEPAGVPIELEESRVIESVDIWSLDEPGLAELYAEAIEESAWFLEEENES